MAVHEFGILEEAPLHGERFDANAPQKRGCIAVDNGYLENEIQRFMNIDTFCHGIDIPYKGLVFSGITIIPPESLDEFLSATNCLEGMDALRMLIKRAKEQKRYMIHYGI